MFTSAQLKVRLHLCDLLRAYSYFCIAKLYCKNCVDNSEFKCYNVLTNLLEV